MKEEKRKVRSYKIMDKHYVRAQKKAAKTDISLAERIEEFVIQYGKPIPKSKSIPLSNDCVSFDKIGIMRIDGTVEPLLYKDKMAPLLGEAINGTRKTKRK